MINLKQAVDFMLEHGYMAVLQDELVITNKLQREFKAIPADGLDTVFAGEQFMDRKSVWDKFIKDACIPYQAEGSSGRKYTLRQYSDGLGTLLVSIIKKCDYKILTESAKRYYNTATFKLILSNYLKGQVWYEEYKRYEEALAKGGAATYGSGGNSWET
jgi:hypothetical protein